MKPLHFLRRVFRHHLRYHLRHRLHQQLSQVVVAIACVVLGASPAVASLAGDTVRVTYFYPDLNTPYTDFGTAVIASAGTDFVDPRGAFTLRVTDTRIVASDFNFSAFWLPADFNGLVLTNLTDSFPSLYAIDPATNMSGFGAGNVAVSGNELRIDWQGLSFNPDTQVVINLGVVPEPHTWVMLAGGLALMGVIGRRRRRG